MRLATHLLFLVSLTLAACGGSSDPKDLTDSGYRSLGAGDFAAAVADFDRALASIGEDLTSPLYLRAKMGAVEARAKTDPDRAQADFLALSAALPTQVTDRDFSRIAGRLGDAGYFQSAIALLEAGKQSHPDSTYLDALGMKLAEQANQADDPAAIEALRGLGYVGE